MTADGSDAVPVELREEIIAALRRAGARFALVHGSRAGPTHRPSSDIDVAAWWGGGAPASFEVDLPPDVDLVVLDGAPLEIAGRVAMGGVLLFDDDPPARVRWLALLGTHGVLEVTLAARLRQAVGFRNVLVHEYVEVDDRVVEARLADPADLTDFVATVAAWTSSAG